MLNKVQLIGRLGAAPEVNTLNNGGAVATANIATSRRWKDKQSGEQKEQTEWHRIVFFNHGNYKLAEIAGEYLKKGGLVYIEGRLQTRKWTDNDGVDRYTTEIMAETMHMLESKSGSYKDNIPPVSAYEQAQPAQNANAAPDFDDDIPF